MSDSSGTLWIVFCQAPLSMGFPRQESWSGGHRQVPWTSGQHVSEKERDSIPTLPWDQIAFQIFSFIINKKASYTIGVSALCCTDSKAPIQSGTFSGLGYALRTAVYLEWEPKHLMSSCFRLASHHADKSVNLSSFLLYFL